MRKEDIRIGRLYPRRCAEDGAYLVTDIVDGHVKAQPVHSLTVEDFLQNVRLPSEPVVQPGTQFAVLKYRLAMHPLPQTILMPVGARIVHFGMQHALPTIWAEVEKREVWAEEPRTFLGLTTGEQSPPVGSRAHVGTAVMHDDSFVIHFFEVTAP